MSEVVTISGLAAGGDGVGHLADGRAVFVPRTVPGDSVALRTGVKLHRSFARGEVGEILRPGPARVAPACPHFAKDRCGGCQFQQLAYDAQLAAKRAIVGDALRRIGKLELADPEIVEAIEEWRYRSEITLHAVRLPGRDGNVVGIASLRSSGGGVPAARLPRRGLPADGAVARGEAAPRHAAAPSHPADAAARSGWPPASDRGVARGAVAGRAGAPRLHSRSDLLVASGRWRGARGGGTGHGVPPDGVRADQRGDGAARAHLGGGAARRPARPRGVGPVRRHRRHGDAVGGAGRGGGER